MVVQISGQNVEVLLVDIANKSVDWRRTEGAYTGACVSYFPEADPQTAVELEAVVAAAIEADLTVV